VFEAIGAHRRHLEESGELARRRERRIAEELGEIVARSLEERARRLCEGPEYDRLYQRVLAREVDPWTAASEIVDRVDRAGQDATERGGG
jgi:LAO/AO transport system kinase